MKRILSLLLAFATVVSATALNVFAEDSGTDKKATPVWKNIYVSVAGTESGDGSKEKPFKTINAAKEWVRANSDNMQGDIVVNVLPGTYFQNETLFFDSADSGKNGYNVIYKGAGNNKTVISGGEKITGFKKSEYDGIWVADAPDFDYILQLRVNGKRRFVAKTAKQINGVKKSEKYDNEEWYLEHPNDEKDNHYNYYNPDTPYRYDGFYVSKYDLGIYENQEDMLLKCDKDWWTTTVPIKKIEQDPDMSDQLRITLDPYYNRAVKNAETTPKREVTIMNAFELLDEPGEFYFNKKTKKVYYMPEKGENMNTAEVYAPKIEMLFYINGEDVDKKVENLTFEGFTFSDTRWNFNKPAYLGQATEVQSTGSCFAPRAVLIEFADNVNFEGNCFNNIGGGAIDYRNACTNCRIVGNVFYDIGENGVVVGSHNHGDFSLGSYNSPTITDNSQLSSDGISDPVPEKYADYPVDLMSLVTTKIDASVYTVDMVQKNGYNWSALNYPGYPHTDNNDLVHYSTIHQTWFDKDKIEYKGYWQDAYSVTQGKSPWVSFEFVKPYKLEDIIVTFDSSYITPEQKTNYKVIASNDAKFEEYDVIAEQKTVANDVNTYNVNTGKSYKYVKIQSNDSKDFAVSRVFITTRDIKPFVKNQRCKFLTIQNNYITRVGIDAPRSIGLVVTHGEDFDISHNDVYDIGYTGMSIGFTWTQFRNSCYRMNVSYNKVNKVTQTGHDGGGIYVLGPQPGSHYHHNYISGVRQGINGFYTDNGSRYETITDNVIRMAPRILSPYANIYDNIYMNNYATQPICADDSKDWQTVFEYPKITAIGVPEYEGEYDTLLNAGLEKDYMHIKDMVPKGTTNLYDYYSYNKIMNAYERASFFSLTIQGMKKTFSNLGEKSKYGTGLSELPYSESYLLNNTVSYLDGSSNSDVYMQYTRAREFEERVINEYDTPKSLEDVLKICAEKLENAKSKIAASDDAKSSCGRYPESAVSEFEAVYNKYKDISPEALSTTETWNAVSALSNAANKLENARYAGAIEYVYADRAIDSKIDKESRTVTLTFPVNEDISAVALDLKLHSGAIAGKNMSGEVDLRNPITIPVYCKGNSRYTIWTVKTEFEEPADNKNVGAGEWKTTTEELDRLRETDDGIVLPAWEYLMMSNAYSKADNGGYLNFMPMTKNEKNKFTLVIGADTPKNQEVSSTCQKRCEIDFDGNTAAFYKNVDGKRTKLAECKQTGIKYDEKNKLEYTIENINNNSYFKVYLNGKAIFSTVAEKITFGKYVGFINRFMNIKIFKTEV